MNAYHIKLKQYSCVVDFNTSNSKYQVYGFKSTIYIYPSDIYTKEFKGLSTALFYASQVLARLGEESEKVHKL